jgi:hypothetical protein
MRKFDLNYLIIFNLGITYFGCLFLMQLFILLNKRFFNFILVSRLYTRDKKKFKRNFGIIYIFKTLINAKDGRNKSKR